MNCLIITITTTLLLTTTSALQSCFKYFDTWSSYEVATGACKSLDHDGSTNWELATIENVLQNDEIMSYVEARGMWFGYNNQQGQGFEWIDGSASTYENWDLNQPSNTLLGNQGEYCGMMRNQYVTSGVAGKWNDLHCVHTLPYMCRNLDLCPTTSCP